MNKIKKLLADQNTKFELKESRVKNLNSSVANKIIEANSKENALKILRNYRINYETIRMM